VRVAGWQGGRIAPALDEGQEEVAARGLVVSLAGRPQGNVHVGALGGDRGENPSRAAQRRSTSTSSSSRSSVGVGGSASAMPPVQVQALTRSAPRS